MNCVGRLLCRFRVLWRGDECVRLKEIREGDGTYIRYACRQSSCWLCLAWFGGLLCGLEHFWLRIWLPHYQDVTSTTTITHVSLPRAFSHYHPSTNYINQRHLSNLRTFSYAFFSPTQSTTLSLSLCAPQPAIWPFPASCSCCSVSPSTDLHSFAAPRNQPFLGMTFYEWESHLVIPEVRIYWRWWGISEAGERPRGSRVWLGYLRPLSR